MAFHQEWAWYNLYFPNPDGALCRQHMTEQEWQRMTRWRDFDWFNHGGQESNKILTYTQQKATPTRNSDGKLQPHLLPPAGVISSTHARRHPGFYMEMYHRLLHEREYLVRQGLLPHDLPCPSFHNPCSCTME
ncbi:hypothetical protein Bpfe_022787 [Biomphalaria pfeifferi]|uniref:Uncharacterized protein n=1 Tax=Biomphalaria pfeifferi TaxID=112525 RepID=A0AAD8F0Z3_BIOPF|nr:hypothetical protein Bpfe_022787 [Biomphalaria pfeifferi]